MHPHDHRCDVGDLDRSEETVRCHVCGRVWTLGSRGWQPHPVTTPAPPRR